MPSACRGLRGVDGPANHSPRVGVQDDVAVQTLPFGVGCSVMSVPHSWFSQLLAKSRLTCSTAMLSGLLRFHFGRPVRPRRPARLHQHLARAAPDRDAVPDRDLGAVASPVVDSAGPDVGSG